MRIIDLRKQAMRPRLVRWVENEHPNFDTPFMREKMFMKRSDEHSMQYYLRLYNLSEGYGVACIQSPLGSRDFQVVPYGDHSTQLRAEHVFDNVVDNMRRMPGMEEVGQMDTALVPSGIEMVAGTKTASTMDNPVDFMIMVRDQAAQSAQANKADRDNADMDYTKGMHAGIVIGYESVIDLLNTGIERFQKQP